MNSELCMAGMLPTSTCSSDGSPRTRRLREANNILLDICTFVIRQFVWLCHLYLHIKYTYTYSEAIAKNRRRAAVQFMLSLFSELVRRSLEMFQWQPMQQQTVQDQPIVQPNPNINKENQWSIGVLQVRTNYLHLFLCVIKLVYM